MHLTNAMIKALENGSIPTVVLYSDTDVTPEPPYVVVKLEAGALPSTRQYRITVHHLKGRLDDLEAYALNEIDKLLPGFVYDEDGSRYRFYKLGYTDVTAELRDDGYFMERIFSVPLPGAH